jgi:transcriptional regulator with XRE-family HTH domain
MQPLTTRSKQHLLIEARRTLGMNQLKFATAIRRSVRTLSRFEGGRYSPTADDLQRVAALLLPVDPALAAEAAAWGGTTLEALGLVPSPATEASPEATRADAEAAALARSAYADAVVMAALEALGSAPASVETGRAAVRAAFILARRLGLEPTEVVDALAVPPVASP